MTVPDDYRKESRARWGRQARGWGAQAERLASTTMPVSVWMVDALDLQPGHEVLELAAGTGEVGFLAAEQIEPGGTLISSDFVPEMITVAQARAERLGITNVRFRQIDAESIDQPAASLDGVLCRWGYMLMADGEAALRETRRILRPGARVALAAWTSARARTRGRRSRRASWSAAATCERARPRRPGPVRLGAQRDHRGAAERRGLRRARGRRRRLHPGLPLLRRLDRHPARAREPLPRGARRARRGRARRRPGDRARAGAPYVQEDGSLALPARTWVAVAGA